MVDGHQCASAVDIYNVMLLDQVSKCHIRPSGIKSTVSNLGLITMMEDELGFDRYERTFYHMNVQQISPMVDKQCHLTIPSLSCKVTSGTQLSKSRIQGPGSGDKYL